MTTLRREVREAESSSDGTGANGGTASLIPITIPLDLSEQMKKTFHDQLSSQNYYNLLLGILMPSDLLYTYFFRYNRLLDVDLPNARDAGISGTQGGYIDYTAAHPVVGVAVTFAFVAVAAASIYSVYLSQRRDMRNTSYKYLYDTFKDETKKKHIEEIATSADETEEDKLAAIINHYLETILDEDAELKKKYEKIRINHHTFEIKLRNSVAEQKQAEDNKPKPQTLLRKFTNKVLSPAWESLSISSFTYWILWIGASLFTGVLDSPGVFGVTPWVSFGIPILSGLLYPAIKVYNYYKNKRVKAAMLSTEGLPVTSELKEAVTKDACELLRRSLLRCEYELDKKSLEARIAAQRNKISELGGDPTAQVFHFPKPKRKISVMDDKILKLKTGMTRKVTIALFSTATGMFVAAQYAAWIATDFIDVLFNVSIAIPVANVVLGALFFAAVGTFGLYNAYMRYDKVKEFESKKEINELGAKQAEILGLEQRLETHQQNIKAHEKLLGRKPRPMSKTYLEEQFFTDVNRRGETNKTLIGKIGSRLFQFINGICTGVFLGRIFLVKGNALVLPFAAAMFSTPVTIGLLVGVGVLYGAFKVYEYHKDRQERRAALLLNQRAERVVCLKREVELAALNDYQLKLEVQTKVLEDGAKALENKHEKSLETAVDIELTAAMAEKLASMVNAAPYTNSNGHVNGNGHTNGHAYTNGHSVGGSRHSTFRRNNGVAPAPIENGVSLENGHQHRVAVGG